MLLYQKRGLQSSNCSVVNIKAKKQGGIVLRRRLIVNCLHSEFRGFLIRGFSVCCHLAEIEHVITPRKITLFKYKSWTEQQIRRRQNVVISRTSVSRFEEERKLNQNEGEKLRQSNFGGEVGGFCLRFTHKFKDLPLTLLTAFNHTFS